MKRWLQHFKISELYDDKYHLAITRKPVITTNCIEYKQTINILESNEEASQMKICLVCF